MKIFRCAVCETELDSIDLDNNLITWGVFRSTCTDCIGDDAEQVQATLVRRANAVPDEEDDGTPKYRTSSITQNPIRVRATDSGKAFQDMIKTRRGRHRVTRSYDVAPRKSLRVL